MTRSTDPQNCPFCAIISDRGNNLRTRMIADWVDTIAIEPLDPVVAGHTLVIPAVHVEDALEDAEVTGQTMEHAARLADLLPPKSWNIITSVGSAATQTVHHLHIHLVPRRDGDGLALPWTPPTEVRASALEGHRPICPVHSIPDCSPLLNGCQAPFYLRNQLDEHARLIRLGEDDSRFRR